MLTPLPLCVDLEETLIRSDPLFECVMLLVKRNPLYLFCVPFWLLRGKAYLRAVLAPRVKLNPAALAYHRELVENLKSERQAGRSIWLCTSANKQLAAAVAAHVGLFDGVLVRDPEQLARHFGRRGFEEARPGPSRRFGRIRAVIRALRPHQWAKNSLVLVPLLAAHRIGDLRAVLAALLAVAAFCLCASSVYIINDLLDLEADRAHARKSKRPFASGEVSIAAGLLLSPALLAAAVVIAALLPPTFWAVLAAYYALTSAYSFFLKKFLLVDALALAGLYTLRIIAGAAAIDVPLSFWLLLFSVFLFLSLAFVKRFAELDALQRQQRLRAVGRGYHVEDLSALQTLGSSAGYMSVMVLALYINSPEIQALYHRPKLVWMLCVLMLYWISRVWMMAQRGHMHDDPVVFALKDHQSVAIGICAAITMTLAV